MANFGSPIPINSPSDSIDVNHEFESPIEVQANGLPNESTVGCLRVFFYFFVFIVYSIFNCAFLIFVD